MVAKYESYNGKMMTRGQLAEKFAREDPGLTWSELHQRIKAASGVNLSMSTVKLAMQKIKNSQKANGSVPSCCPVSPTLSVPTASGVPVNSSQNVDRIISALELFKGLLTLCGSREKMRDMLKAIYAEDRSVVEKLLEIL